MFLYTDIPKKESETIDTLEEGLINDLSPRTPFNTPYNTESESETVNKTPFFTFVPTILFFAQFVIAMGSGMTVKYWPLFLKNECHMSMKTIQILSIIVILEIIVFQYIAQTISKKLGRIYTVFMLNMMGITAQTALGLLPDYNNARLIGFLYTFRFSIMNSSGPLISSALMDIVPKDHRARWGSLSSIVTLGWCGSALLGGFINDKTDYSNTFLVTSGCHLIGNFIYLLVRNSIPDENKN
jgi:predicted MFS family arabinose efflux permease